MRCVYICAIESVCAARADVQPRNPTTNEHQYTKKKPEHDMGVYTAPRSVLLPTTLIIKVVIHHMHLVQRLRQLTTSLRPHSRPPGAVTRPLSRFGPRLKYAVIPVTRAGVGRCTWRTLPENHVNIIYTALGAATTMRNDRSRPYNGSNAPSRRSKSIGTIRSACHRSKLLYSPRRGAVAAYAG